jgi:hypothetical protein
MQQKALIIHALGRAGRSGKTPTAARAARPLQAAPAAQAEKAHGDSPESAPSQDKAQAFFQILRERKNICWEELVPEFRANYYEAYDELISVLFATDDVFVIYNVVRFADFSQPQEVKAHVRFIEECDPEKHQVSLRALAQTKIPELLEALRNKEGLPDSVHEALQGSQKQTAQPKTSKGGSTPNRPRESKLGGG